MTKKSIILALFANLYSCLVPAQQKYGSVKEIYLVRHAEKDTGKNPAISLIGKERAGDLYRELKNKGIQKIFVSQYRRSQMTGDSLRIYAGIDTMHYMADTTGKGLISRLTGQKKIKRVLVVAHSNTIPAIIRSFGHPYPQAEIADNEYDNLFLLRLKKSKTVLSTKKYGKPSPPTDGKKMLQ